jgi:NTP pyrophosphatase (non-canonical NTP hydrolase)
MDQTHAIGAVDRAIKRGEKARSRYGEYASLHEILGVLEEEFLELKMACHKSDWQEMREEMIDIAAVCLRGAEEITTREKLKQI